jgi:glycosyltransferase involved in cell wall biosynthesis
MDLSIVIPLYNEEESIPELVSWIGRVIRGMGCSYEIIVVDDGSTDSSWKVINRLAASDPAVKAIKFRRNYGKSAALFSGFEESSGEVVITMDADLQDSPDEIPALYQMIREEEYDLVSGWKKKRHDPISKTLPSRVFNTTARLITGIKLHDFNCGLKAYRKDVIKTIEVYGEMHRYIPVLVKQAGFLRIGEKVVMHQKRKFGVTKFGLERFMTGYLDMITITFITRFGKRPMHLFGTLGTLIFLLGFVSAIYLGARKLINVHHHIPAIKVTDSPYFYIALTCMILGTLFFLAGFLGELVNRNSPIRNFYHVDKRVNL